ncbi:MAG: sulfite exporter TauE/SafE family protein [Bacteroidales bacterium]|nr:sulfite exporter TauE/SafE family protein [Bacteroidales bacterium]
MEVWTYIGLFALTVASSFTQRVTGFGFGILMMTLLPVLAPSYAEATALSGLLAIFTALVPAIQSRKSLNWKKLLPILLIFLVTSWLGVLLLARLDSSLMKHVVGGVLIAVSLWFFITGGRIRLAPTLPVQAGMGTLSGLMGGLFAMQGPPAVIYFLAVSDTKEEYIALTQWYFLIGNIFMAFFRAGSGFITPAVLKLWCVAIPGVFLGLFLGAKVYKKIRTEELRRVIYAFLLIAGLLAILG